MAQERLPITLLSGFLGAGKTTLLQEVLRNKGGVKVAVIVNDVAEINIDSKLVKERTNGGQEGDPADFVELQNGCVCCNASGDLVQSILQLLRTAKSKEATYDRIIIELSGIAEPKKVRGVFQELADAAREAGNAMIGQLQLQTMITVVDSTSFIHLYQSQHKIAEREELYLEKQKGGAHSKRNVVDLLVEQVECADYIIVNKTDLSTDDELSTLRAAIPTLNPTAQMLSSSFGKVPLETVLGPPMSSQWVSERDEENEVRHALRAAKDSIRNQIKSMEGSDHGHGHGHDHSHEHTNHGHQHESHSHSGGHSHGDHAHTHAKDQQDTSAAEKYGITSFVYSRRRPFNPQRLQKVTSLLTSRLQDVSGAASTNWEFPTLASSEPAEDPEDPMRAVIRSKGFVWVSNLPKALRYWSHAGHHFELSTLGLWWAATSLRDWPQEGNPESAEVANIISDFAAGPDTATLWGDRRQEIVFIGVGMQRTRIEALLDECLLSDEEMVAHDQQIQSSGYKDRVVIDPVTGQPVSQ